MPKPIHVVTDFKTRRTEMRETINAVLPHRSPMLGLAIGFSCAIVLVCSGAWVFMMHAGA